MNQLYNVKGAVLGGLNSGYGNSDQFQKSNYVHSQSSSSSDSSHNSSIDKKNPNAISIIED